tara:strand:+ start:78 stop:284 length:207 start_codon:yes stop_codon:yes gene_type:complete
VLFEYILIVESEVNYMNAILYIGLGLMFVGFVGFLISASMENYYTKKLKDLDKKYNFEYIKIKPKVKK